MPLPLLLLVLISMVVVVLIAVQQRCVSSAALYCLAAWSTASAHTFTQCDDDQLCKLRA
jgi:hypothetical protein